VAVAIYLIAGRPPMSAVPTEPMTPAQQEIINEQPPAEAPAPAPEQQPAPPKTP